MNNTSVNPTCKLKLDINNKIINEIFECLAKKVEYAGDFHCDDNDNITGVNLKSGDSNSVYTPNNVINFHTHPISAYREADCVWGWPSGEDIRESIKFGLAGNKAHLVFTNEGLYTIQVSPCKLIKMKELTDQERCILIFAIEEYFKTTHNFRGIDEVNDLAKNNIFINPYSFIDFANTFNLNNLLTQTHKSFNEVPSISISDVGHTGIHSNVNNNVSRYSKSDGSEKFSKIPNIGFPEVNETKICTKPLCKTITAQDVKDNTRLINCNGREGYNIKLKVQDIFTKLQQITAKFNDKPCKELWNSKPDAWFYVNFFKSNRYLNKEYLKGNKFGKPDPVDEHIKIGAESAFIRIFSNEKTGCSVNSIKITK
jgi:hypothetical protein